MKKLVVLGAGISGVGACILAKKEGWEVFLSDYSTIKLSEKKTLEELNVSYEEQNHNLEKILEADLIVKSPGIPDTIPLIAKIKEKQIAIISEIEFAYRSITNQKIIAVTGSNGKTTTVSLLQHTLNLAGIKSSLVGNIGVSFAEQVALSDSDVFVVELSSFQLDGCVNFKPDIAIILNITPDHLDRYENMQAYVNSKWSIAKNQTAEELLIVWKEDDFTAEKIDSVNSRLQTYSLLDFNSDACFKDDSIQTKSFKLPNQFFSLKGEHNIKNMLSVALVAEELNIAEELLINSFSSFKSVEHRLEFVRDRNGIQYINDSKATNVDATKYALGSYPENIIWLVGGVDKGNDYSLLQDTISSIKAIVIVGSDKENILEYFKNKVSVIDFGENMQEALEVANKIAKSGDVVLLSPACASFDLFDNYEHRGRVFKEIVNNL